MSPGVKRELDGIVETIIYLVTESRRLARDVSAKYGVTPTQLSVVKLLHEIGDLRLGELSRRISAQNSTVTGIVDRMVEAGLVERVQSADDRRVWKIGLTPRGREVAKRADVSPWDTLRGALEALPRGDKRKLVEILTQLAQDVAQAVGERKEMIS
jgi:DNA-binding MarR family transcriptional regulator